MQEERHKKKLQGNDPAVRSPGWHAPPLASGMACVEGLYVFDARCAILQLHFVTALPPSLEKWRWTVEKVRGGDPHARGPRLC